MMDAREIMEWLATLPAGSQVGIDEGGLTLVVVQDGKLVQDEWCECGGIPEEIENAAS